MSRYVSLQLMFLVAALAVGMSVSAAEPKLNATKITISGEMCGGCVKKLTGTLTAVEGVAAVAGDVETKTMTIRPKGRAALSPKALWEACEKAGKKPAKLAGLHGTFTTKPKS